MAQSENVGDTIQNTDQERTFTTISDEPIRTTGDRQPIPSPKSSQDIARYILGLVKALQEQRIWLQLHWIPGHSGNRGNKTTDQLAKEAVSPREDYNFRRPRLYAPEDYPRENHGRVAT